MKILFILLGGFLVSALAQAQSVAPAQTTVRTSPVAVGEMAPDFTLEDFRVENDEWRKVTLSVSRDSAAAVLVFYRGHW